MWGFGGLPYLACMGTCCLTGFGLSVLAILSELMIDLVLVFRKEPTWCAFYPLSVLIRVLKPKMSNTGQAF